MKLLLTSAGLTNNSISKALFDLVGKEPSDTTVAFIPTASNVETGDKSWLINDLNNLKKQNFKAIHIVDISAVGETVWKPQLESADVLFFEGGNTFHLMRWMDRSGLSKILPELLKTRVYVGVSAGSMITSKDLALKLSQDLYGEDLKESENLNGLNFVDLYILPHLNSKYFTNVRIDSIKESVKGMTEKIYALDDQSALKIIDGKVEIVSEREHLIFN